MIVKPPQTLECILGEIQSSIFKIESLARITSLSMHTNMVSKEANIPFDVTHMMECIMEITRDLFDKTEIIDFGVPDEILKQECKL